MWIARALVVAAALATLAALPLAAQGGDRYRERTDRACMGEARSEHLRVLERRQPEPVQGRGYGSVLFQQKLRVQDRGGSTWVLCLYDPQRDRVGLHIADRGHDRDRYDTPSSRETAAACMRAAERRDFRGLRVVSESERYRDRRPVGRIVAMNAQRERRDYRVNCYYDFRSRETALEAFRR